MTHSVAAGVLMAIAFGTALGAEPSGAGVPRPVWLIPQVGVRGGANLEANTSGVPPATADPSVSFGLAVDVYLRPDAWFEAFIDHQTLHFSSVPATSGASGFDFAVDYLEVGGGYGSTEGSVRPYVAAAVGLTRYGASPGDVGSSVGASGSLGGGIRVPMGKRLALRFEVRGYATISDAAIAVTCGPGCSVQFSADGWYQFAGTFGLAFRL